MENAYQPSVRRKVVGINGGNRISLMLLIDDHGMEKVVSGCM